MAQTFSDRLKDLRKNKELTQEALATSMGTTLSTVARWESGKSIPHPNTIAKLSAFFGVAYPWLFNGEGEMRPFGDSTKDAVLERFNRTPISVNPKMGGPGPIPVNKPAAVLPDGEIISLSELRQFMEDVLMDDLKGLGEHSKTLDDAQMLKLAQSIRRIREEIQ